MRVVRWALVLVIALVLGLSLLGCAGTQACGDTCPAAGDTKVMTYTPNGESEPILTFRMPGYADYFFDKPYRYAGAVPLARSEIAALAILEWQKVIDVSGTPGIEAWSLLIFSVVEDGEQQNTVLAICHSVKVGDKTAQRFFFTEPRGLYLTEGDEVAANELIEKVTAAINGTNV